MPRLVVETASGTFIRKLDVNVDELGRLPGLLSAWHEAEGIEKVAHEQRDAHRNAGVDDHEFVVGNSRCIVCGAEVDDV